MGVFASGQLWPQPLVERLLHASSLELKQEPFGPLILVVAAPIEDPYPFLEELTHSVLKEAPPSSLGSALVHTGEFPTLPVPNSDGPESDQIELLAELADAPHCIVPICTRSGLRTIRIGRSSSNQIVLTDPSVSTHHACLTVDNGSVEIRDEGSKNGTLVSGAFLEPGRPRWLQPMDRLTFGRVSAFVCDPRTLRAVLRADIRTLI